MVSFGSKLAAKAALHRVEAVVTCSLDPHVGTRSRLHRAPTLGMLVACRSSSTRSRPCAASPAALADHEGEALLLVNVASKCGLTPQYTGLEQLQQTYGDRGFSVSGSRATSSAGRSRAVGRGDRDVLLDDLRRVVPDDEKIDVNGPDRHPIYDELTAVADAEGHDGDIRWNFEKFLVDPDGTSPASARWSTPEDPKLVAAIEGALPA